MGSDDFDEHVAELRKSYVEATPRQRYSIAQQRIEHPEHGPNVLVASVSAVEGLARSLAMHRRAQTKAELSALYPKYKWRSPEELVEEYLLGGGLGNAAAYFGGEIWERFRYQAGPLARSNRGMSHGPAHACGGGWFEAGWCLMAFNRTPAYVASFSRASVAGRRLT